MLASPPVPAVRSPTRELHGCEVDAGHATVSVNGDERTERMSARSSSVVTRVHGADPRSSQDGYGPHRNRGLSPNQWRCQMAEPVPPAEGIVLAHFIVSDDVERSRRFYTEVLGGTVVFGPEPTNIALANGFIIIKIQAGVRPTTSPRSPLRRQATPTGSAASSTSGSPTFTPFTPMERPRRPVPDAAEAAPVRDPVLV